MYIGETNRLSLVSRIVILGVNRKAGRKRRVLPIGKRPSATPAALTVLHIVSLEAVIFLIGKERVAGHGEFAVTAAVLPRGVQSRAHTSRLVARPITLLVSSLRIAVLSGEHRPITAETGRGDSRLGARKARAAQERRGGHVIAAVMDLILGDGRASSRINLDKRKAEVSHVAHLGAHGRL